MEVQPIWLKPVTYGAIGGTKAADLMAYPPKGFRPFEQRSRIGHGDSRWEFAWQQTMTWGIQTRSGFSVELVEPPRHGVSETKVGHSIRRGGPQRLRTEDNEIIYGGHGEESIAAGDTAILTLGFGPIKFRAPCRVIWIIDEPKRKGFAYGTLPGHPESGEECFIVEQTDEGSVWLTVRAFSRPATWWAWAGYPVTRLVQYLVNRRYFQALAGPMN